MELTEELKRTYIETAELLKGSDRRMFIAKIVKSLGYGGQSQAERELGWNRGTSRRCDWAILKRGALSGRSQSG